MSSTSSSATQAVRAENFINSIGVNTHIDFTSTAYGNLSVVESALEYIGVKNVRDSAGSSADVGTNGLWQQVANATGVTFDAYLPEGSPAAMQSSLNYIQEMASQHIITSIEGGDEEDDTYAASNGNSLAYTAQYQQQVYDVGQSLGLPVINMSFGSGWSTNSSEGDYANVGNISSYSNYANAHVYFGTGNSPSYNISLVNGLAQISADHPVIITEMGWYTTGSTTDANSVSDTVQAKYMLDGLMDAYQDGDVKTYLYELLDQKSGDGNSEDNFGLFNSDGTPKLAATALHNLTTLLADTGSTSATFTPGTLSYSLSGMTSSDNSMLMEKSNGTYWLAIWDETRLSGPTTPTDITVANQTITLTLGSAASSILVFDPLTGTTAVQTVNNAATAQISVPDHPVLVEIITSGSSGSGSSSGSGGSTGGGTSTGGTLSSNDLSVTVPASLAATAGSSVQMAASITDAWGASNGGTMALNITTTGGVVTMTDGSGNAVAGSGTNAIHLNGTEAQLNADLATLNFVAPTGAGTDTVSVNVWNQAGVSTTQSTAIGVTAGSSSSGSGSSSSGSTLSSNDTSIALPGSVSLAENTAVQVSGVSISDPWAASNPGSISLNVTTTSGTISMTNSSGQAIAGSGTGAIHLSGTLAQIDADLATLSYNAPSTTSSGDISVNIWNQAGVSTTQVIATNNLVSGNVSNASNNAILSATSGGSLTGSGIGDTFYFTPQNTGTKVDHITDFSQTNSDKIDLHGFGLSAASFNSSGSLSGAQSLTFVQGTDASGHPYTLVEIETNGSHTPQYEIQLDGVHATLHATDFTFA